MHQTKKKKLPVHQQEAKGAQIGIPGHVECIKLKKNNPWCTNRGPKVLKLAAHNMWNRLDQNK